MHFLENVVLDVGWILIPVLAEEAYVHVIHNHDNVRLNVKQIKAVLKINIVM
jgi:hypothetical protein